MPLGSHGEEDGGQWQDGKVLGSACPIVLVHSRLERLKTHTAGEQEMRAGMHLEGA